MAGKADVLRTANAILRDQGSNNAVDHVQFDAIFRAIYELVRDDDKVIIQHFGTFVRRQRAERRVWDSSKNAPRVVPAVSKLMFRTKICFEKESAS